MGGRGGGSGDEHDGAEPQAEATEADMEMKADAETEVKADGEVAETTEEVKAAEEPAPEKEGEAPAQPEAAS